jgi:decaprenyl-phosphate phosphoribosyltransferase
MDTQSKTLDASAPHASLGAYIRIARPDHWIKNLFVIPGTVAAVVLLERSFVSAIPQLLIALIATCLIASANYVINEWLDAEYDRFHPVKKSRPSAVGGIRPTLVYLEYAILAAAGLLLATLISLPFLLTAGWLLVMGVLYNVRPARTKDRFLFDVLSESINNPIRLLLGWFVVTEVFLPPASLLVGYWMGGAFLMAVKRYSEYRFIGNAETASLYRRSFRFYTEETLLLSSLFYAITASLFLGIFLTRYRLELFLSFPLLALLFVWYFHIGLKADSAAQHPEKLYRERRFLTFVGCLVAWIAVLMYVDMPWLYQWLESSLVAFR